MSKLHFPFIPLTPTRKEFPHHRQMLLSSTEKPGPNWLDRLRSSKGFPIETDLDLETFLNPNPSSSSSSSSSFSSSIPNSDQIHSHPTSNSLLSHGKRVSNPSKREIFTNVLSDLFVMGNSNGFDRIRETNSSRKQRNPKFCLLSVESGEGGGPSSADNSVVLADAKKQGENMVVEEDMTSMNFAGYSREDVMIIDTSAPMWKSEKFIYRKGNVWKIRDKKSKGLYGCRRKRKASQLNRESEGKKKKKKNKKVKSKMMLKKSKRDKKKQKISHTHEPMTTLSRESRRGLPCEGGLENDKMKAGKGKETQEKLDQFPRLRRLIGRSPRKPTQRNSTIFSLKNGARSTKNLPPPPSFGPRDSC